MGHVFLFMMTVLAGGLLSQPLLACSPPVFPQPEMVADLMIEQDSGTILLPEEEAMLADYQRDREHFFELYEAAGPCPAEGRSHMNLTAAEQDLVQEEMAALSEKWQADPDEGASPETFYDLPAEEMMINLE